MEIDGIEKTSNGGVCNWTIATQQGEIQFTSEGYEQYIRQEPFFEFGQNISYIERMGYSLERTINQENSNRSGEDVLIRRQKNLEDYENLKKRHVLKRELALLLQAREKNEIDTKSFLIKKREINDMVSSYTSLLQGTRFED